MRLVGARAAVRRIWTVELRPRAGGPTLICGHCTAHTPPLEAASARSAALAHLACHARADALPDYLRTCQCQQRGCSWHPRRRGCAGPVLLALTRDRSGRIWRLADACAACAAATSHTAVVPDTLLTSHWPPAPHPAPAARVGTDERVRVRETLTYLSTALPRCTSPAARMLALQCALRADTRGHVRLPGGLLRGMRLRGRWELWEELSNAGWLRLPDLRPAHVQVWLLDAVALDQVPGRGARCHAAHWALRPTPLILPGRTPPTLRLAALVVAAHTCQGTEMDVLARLCGHSCHQMEELLDQLVAARTLTSWHQDQTTGEVMWHLPQHTAETCRTTGSRRRHMTERTAQHQPSP
ncbi:hypothetical protein [Streptomyces sp. NPDC046862]|uniref:hypothetical protein n=1 Tax=Streptomyces sp. NPDC046862 TaxID=3154603 RepID=UPI003451A43D